MINNKCVTAKIFISQLELQIADCCIGLRQKVTGYLQQWFSLVFIQHGNLVVRFYRL